MLLEVLFLSLFIFYISHRTKDISVITSYINPIVNFFTKLDKIYWFTNFSTIVLGIGIGGFYKKGDSYGII